MEGLINNVDYAIHWLSKPFPVDPPASAARTLSVSEADLEQSDQSLALSSMVDTRDPDPELDGIEQFIVSLSEAAMNPSTERLLGDLGILTSLEQGFYTANPRAEPVGRKVSARRKRRSGMPDNPSQSLSTEGNWGKKASRRKTRSGKYSKILAPRPEKPNERQQSIIRECENCSIPSVVGGGCEGSELGEDIDFLYATVALALITDQYTTKDDDKFLFGSFPSFSNMDEESKDENSIVQSQNGSTGTQQRPLPNNHDDDSPGYRWQDMLCIHSFCAGGSHSFSENGPSSIAAKSAPMNVSSSQIDNQVNSSRSPVSASPIPGLNPEETPRISDRKLSPLESSVLKSISIAPRPAATLPVESPRRKKLCAVADMTVEQRQKSIIDSILDADSVTLPRCNEERKRGASKQFNLLTLPPLPSTIEGCPDKPPNERVFEGFSGSPSQITTNSPCKALEGLNGCSKMETVQVVRQPSDDFVSQITVASTDVFVESKAENFVACKDSATYSTPQTCDDIPVSGATKHNCEDVATEPPYQAQSTKRHRRTPITQGHTMISTINKLKPMTENSSRLDRLLTSTESRSITRRKRMKRGLSLGLHCSKSQFEAATASTESDASWRPIQTVASAVPVVPGVTVQSVSFLENITDNISLHIDQEDRSVWQLETEADSLPDNLSNHLQSSLLRTGIPVVQSTPPIPLSIHHTDQAHGIFSPNECLNTPVAAPQFEATPIASDVDSSTQTITTHRSNAGYPQDSSKSHLTQLEGVELHDTCLSPLNSRWSTLSIPVVESISIECRRAEGMENTSNYSWDGVQSQRGAEIVSVLADTSQNRTKLLLQVVPSVTVQRVDTETSMRENLQHRHHEDDQSDSHAYTETKLVPGDLSHQLQTSVLRSCIAVGPCSPSTPTDILHEDLAHQASQSEFLGPEMVVDVKTQSSPSQNRHPIRIQTSLAQETNDIFLGSRSKEQRTLDIQSESLEQLMIESSPAGIRDQTQISTTSSEVQSKAILFEEHIGIRGATTVKPPSLLHPQFPSFKSIPVVESRLLECHHMDGMEHCYHSDSTQKEFDLSCRVDSLHQRRLSTVGESTDDRARLCATGSVSHLQSTSLQEINVPRTEREKCISSNHLSPLNSSERVPRLAFSSKNTKQGEESCEITVDVQRCDHALPSMNETTEFVLNGQATVMPCCTGSKSPDSEAQLVDDFLREQKYSLRNTLRVQHEDDKNCSSIPRGNQLRRETSCCPMQKVAQSERRNYHAQRNSSSLQSLTEEGTTRPIFNNSGHMSKFKQLTSTLVNWDVRQIEESNSLCNTNSICESSFEMKERSSHAIAIPMAQEIEATGRTEHSKHQLRQLSLNPIEIIDVSTPDEVVTLCEPVKSTRVTCRSPPGGELHLDSLLEDTPRHEGSLPHSISLVPLTRTTSIAFERSDDANNDLRNQVQRKKVSLYDSVSTLCESSMSESIQGAPAKIKRYSTDCRPQHYQRKRRIASTAAFLDLKDFDGPPSPLYEKAHYQSKNRLSRRCLRRVSSSEEIPISRKRSVSDLPGQTTRSHSTDASESACSGDSQPGCFVLPSWAQGSRTKAPPGISREEELRLRSSFLAERHDQIASKTRPHGPELIEVIHVEESFGRGDVFSYGEEEGIVFATTNNCTNIRTPWWQRKEWTFNEPFPSRLAPSSEDIRVKLNSSMNVDSMCRNTSALDTDKSIGRRSESVVPSARENSLLLSYESDESSEIIQFQESESVPVVDGQDIAHDTEQSVSPIEIPAVEQSERGEPARNTLPAEVEPLADHIDVVTNAKNLVRGKDTRLWGVEVVDGIRVVASHKNATASIGSLDYLALPTEYRDRNVPRPYSIDDGAMSFYKMNADKPSRVTARRPSPGQIFDGSRGVVYNHLAAGKVGARGDWTAPSESCYTASNPRYAQITTAHDNNNSDETIVSDPEHPTTPLDCLAFGEHNEGAKKITHVDSINRESYLPILDSNTGTAFYRFTEHPDNASTPSEMYCQEDTERSMRAESGIGNARFTSCRQVSLDEIGEKGIGQLRVSRPGCSKINSTTKGRSKPELRKSKHMMSHSFDSLHSNSSSVEGGSNQELSSGIVEAKIEKSLHRKCERMTEKASVVFFKPNISIYGGTSGTDSMGTFTRSFMQVGQDCSEEESIMAKGRPHREWQHNMKKYETAKYRSSRPGFADPEVHKLRGTNSKADLVYPTYDYYGNDDDDDMALELSRLEKSEEALRKELESIQLRAAHRLWNAKSSCVVAGTQSSESALQSASDTNPRSSLIDLSNVDDTHTDNCSLHSRKRGEVNVIDLLYHSSEGCEKPCVQDTLKSNGLSSRSANFLSEITWRKRSAFDPPGNVACESRSGNEADIVQLRLLEVTHEQDVNCSDTKSVERRQPYNHSEACEKNAPQVMYVQWNVDDDFQYADETPQPIVVGESSYNDMDQAITNTNTKSANQTLKSSIVKSQPHILDLGRGEKCGFKRGQAPESELIFGPKLVTSLDLKEKTCQQLDTKVMSKSTNGLSLDDHDSDTNNDGRQSLVVLPFSSATTSPWPYLRTSGMSGLRKQNTVASWSDDSKMKKLGESHELSQATPALDCTKVVTSNSTAESESGIRGSAKKRPPSQSPVVRSQSSITNGSTGTEEIEIQGDEWNNSIHSVSSLTRSQSPPESSRYHQESKNTLIAGAAHKSANRCISSETNSFPTLETDDALSVVQTDERDTLQTIMSALTSSSIKISDEGENVEVTVTSTDMSHPSEYHDNRAFITPCPDDGDRADGGGCQSFPSPRSSEKSHSNKAVYSGAGTGDPNAVVCAPSNTESIQLLGQQSQSPDAKGNAPAESIIRQDLRDLELDMALSTEFHRQRPLDGPVPRHRCKGFSKSMSEKDTNDTYSPRRSTRHPCNESSIMNRLPSLRLRDDRDDSVTSRSMLESIDSDEAEQRLRDLRIVQRERSQEHSSRTNSSLESHKSIGTHRLSRIPGATAGVGTMPTLGSSSQRIADLRSTLKDRLRKARQELCEERKCSPVSSVSQTRTMELLPEQLSLRTRPNGSEESEAAAAHLVTPRSRFERLRVIQNRLGTRHLDERRNRDVEHVPVEGRPQSRSRFEARLRASRHLRSRMCRFQE